MGFGGLCPSLGMIALGEILTSRCWFCLDLPWPILAVLMVGPSRPLRGRGVCGDGDGCSTDGRLLRLGNCGVGLASLPR